MTETTATDPFTATIAKTVAWFDHAYRFMMDLKAGLVMATLDPVRGIAAVGILLPVESKLLAALLFPHVLGAMAREFPANQVLTSTVGGATLFLTLGPGTTVVSQLDEGTHTTLWGMVFGNPDHVAVAEAKEKAQEEEASEAAKPASLCTCGRHLGHS